MLLFFFFKQKTAYEMRISDWSSDVCSSDLLDALADGLHHFQIDAEQVVAAHPRLAGDPGGDDDDVGAGDVGIIIGAGDLRVKALNRADLRQEIGRASCRERVCQYV